MGSHFECKGILIQQTAAYAHQQNGKAERFVHSIKDTTRALIASSDLSPLCNIDCSISSSSSPYICPSQEPDFEVMTGSQPDYSRMRVWGCLVFPINPAETRKKGGNIHFEAIFVGYEENCLGWRCVNLNGKYSFLNDVIFKETTKGHLGAKQ